MRQTWWLTTLCLSAGVPAWLLLADEGRPVVRPRPKVHFFAPSGGSRSSAVETSASGRAAAAADKPPGDERESARPAKDTVKSASRLAAHPEESVTAEPTAARLPRPSVRTYALDEEAPEAAPAVGEPAAPLSPQTLHRLIEASEAPAAAPESAQPRISRPAARHGAEGSGRTAILPAAGLLDEAPITNAAHTEEAGAPPQIELIGATIPRTRAARKAPVRAPEEGGVAATRLPQSPRTRNPFLDSTAEPDSDPRVAPPQAESAPKSRPVRPSLISYGPAPRTAPGAETSRGSSSSASAPALSVRWIARGDVNVGQECRCTLQVKNSGKSAARQVVVEAVLPDSVQLVAASPEPEAGTRTWPIEEIPAGGTHEIDVTLIPGVRGPLAASANVRFTTTAATTLQVEEPRLQLQVKGTAEVVLGETASPIITVTNSGTGVAHDVRIEAQLPAGLDHPRGKRVVQEIGPLAAGESRSVRLQVSAVEGGEQAIAVEAQAAGGRLNESTRVPIVVVAPSLTARLEGPALRFIHRNARYTLLVSNSSGAATNNIRAAYAVPEGFEFVKAGKGGQYNARSRQVAWFLGRLESGESVQVEFELRPTAEGEFRHEVVLTADHGLQQTAAADTRVDATPALVLEVADLDDPVETGAETAYEIRVRNDGSKSARSVSISCELPADVEFLGCEGPTDHVLESGLLLCRALPELQAGETATWHVKVKGTAAGTLRLRARLSSESIQKPIVVEEVTQFYAD